jgi:Na+/melibiose symporter-like transporter
LLLFILFFEFSAGPITWLYLSEICHEKAASVATALANFMSLAVSIFTLKIVNGFTSNGKDPEQLGYLFIILGVVSLVATLFMFVFMKETRGLTQEERERLFVK